MFTDKNRRFTGILLILLLMTVISAFLSASGQQESRLDEAKNLIAEKKYNEALLILSEIIKYNPDQYEEAVTLSNQILEIRNQYNRMYEELITTLYVDQDVEKGIEIIKRLEDLDPNPNDQTRKTIALAKDASILIANFNYFNEIMDKALVFINEGKYYDALSVYTACLAGGYDGEGLDFNRSVFYSDVIGDIEQESIRSALTTIERDTMIYGMKGKTLDEASDRILAAIGGSTGIEMEKELDSVIGLLTQLSDLSGNIEKESLIVNNLNTRYRESSYENTAPYFLNTMYQVIDGRSSREEEEGINDVLRLIADGKRKSIKEKITETGGALFTGAQEEFLAREYESARENLGTAFTYYKLDMKISYFNEAKIPLNPLPDLRKKDGWLMLPQYPDFMDAQEAARKCLTYIDLSRYGEIIGKYSEKDKKVTINDLNRLQPEIVSIVNNIKGILEDWDNYIKKRKQETTLRYNETETGEIINFCISTIASFLKDNYGILDAVYDDIEKDYESEKVLLAEGEEVDNLVRYYPQRRLTRFKGMQELLLVLEAKVNELKDYLKTNDQYFENSEDMTAINSRSDTLVLNSAELRRNIADQAAIAEDHIFQAGKFKKEGDLRYGEAMSLVKNLKYETARQKIQIASEAYGNSLKHQEDPEVRKLRDSTLIAFAQRITVLENELVIKDVRKLIKRGKNQYSNGLYEDAQDTLLQARTRWEDTQGNTPNEEIDVWLAYVLTALSIKSARVISEKDPLYKDMSQLFNLAKEDYTKGRSLYRQGEKTEGDGYFARANTKLLNILLSFPFNKDARVLQLMIQKENDQEEFTRNFARAINESLASKNSNNVVELRRIYNELKDLEEIDPRYPKLANAIYDLELRLGLRVKPPDPQMVRESEVLTRNARKIVDNRETEKYSIALNQVNEALKKNPDNQAAKSLKDRILSYIEPSSVSIISESDMREYRKAEQLHIEGRYLEAQRIIDQLWQKASNRRYAPLIKLKTRNEALSV
ncbi:MAG: hypothetical protein JW969_04310 [Spirochaetales bacterium]|nr:hypothetical protein [Spirochaetales bacterium]